MADHASVHVPEAQARKAPKSEFYFNLDKIPEFEYDVGTANTFKYWFALYGTILGSDYSPLRTDEARARFVTSKLGTEEYTRFARSIFPKKIDDLRYGELIEELKLFFNPPTSLVRRRLRLFNLTMATSGIGDLRDRIKAHSALSDLESCTTDQLLCIIAVNGLDGPRYRTAKMHAITFLDSHENATIDELFEYLIRYEALWKDTMDDGEYSARSNLTRYPPCHRCGRNNHHQSRCRFRDEICECCKKRGHLVEVCRWATRASYLSMTRERRLGTNRDRSTDENDRRVHSRMKAEAAREAERCQSYSPPFHED